MRENSAKLCTRVATLTGPRWARPMNAVIEVATPVMVRTPLGISTTWTPGYVMIDMTSASSGFLWRRVRVGCAGRAPIDHLSAGYLATHDHPALDQQVERALKLARGLLQPHAGQPPTKDALHRIHAVRARSEVRLDLARNSRGEFLVVVHALGPRRCVARNGHARNSAHALAGLRFLVALRPRARPPHLGHGRLKCR